MTRDEEARPDPDPARQVSDDRAGEWLHPTTGAAQEVVVVLTRHLVVPTAVAERHPDDGPRPLEPTDGPEHRGRIGREALVREVVLELVERPAMPDGSTHDLEHLFGDQRATGHAARRYASWLRKSIARVVVGLGPPIGVAADP